MDNLPWLPLAKILSYLSLDDRIKYRAVSQSWRDCIDNFKETSLCFSELKRGHLFEKRRLVNDKFDRAFIASTKFESFFSNFAKSIFSHLKNLRICRLTLKVSLPLFQIINSFGKLEELNLINLRLGPVEPQLELPNLRRIWIENLNGIGKLILDASKLQRIDLWDCGALRLEIINGESVESIIATSTTYLDVEKFKNLKYLYCFRLEPINDKFLSNLDELEELHFNSGLSIKLLNQKRRYQPSLKLYYRGLLLDLRNHLDELNAVQAENLGQNDKYNYYRFPPKEQIDCYIENQPRLADQILINYSRCMDYSVIEQTISKTPTDFWQRFVGLRDIRVYGLIHPKGIQQFLRFLKSLENISKLDFKSCRTQLLFDQLPEHCAGLQKLAIRSEVSNLRFLFKLKHLIDISLRNQIDEAFLRKVFNKFEFVLSFEFFNRFDSQAKLVKQPNSDQFEVSIFCQKPVLSSLNKAISSLNFGAPLKVKRK